MFRETTCQFQRTDCTMEATLKKCQPLKDKYDICFKQTTSLDSVLGSVFPSLPSIQNTQSKENTEKLEDLSSDCETLFEVRLMFLFYENNALNMIKLYRTINFAWKRQCQTT